MPPIPPLLTEEDTALGLAGWTGHSRGMTAAHRHLDLEINYVLTGPMTYLLGGRMVELPLRRICLLWGGVPHQMVRSPQAAEVIWITIPLNIVMRWGLPETLIRPLLTTGFLEDAAPREGDFDLLSQWLDDLPGRGERGKDRPPEEAVQRIVLLEIEARLRRFDRGLPPSPPFVLARSEVKAAHSDKGIAAVETMASFITRNFAEEIGVPQIAEAAYLHPNYAMTLFRQHTGMTLSQYLTLQRVAHAQRLLSVSDLPIHEIALQSGFGSVSRFYEAFRHHTGTSPRRFRLNLNLMARPTSP
jgi:AraC-like DNA-binding protein